MWFTVYMREGPPHTPKIPDYKKLDRYVLKILTREQLSEMNQIAETVYRQQLESIKPPVTIMELNNLLENLRRQVRSFAGQIDGNTEPDELEVYYTQRRVIHRLENHLQQLRSGTAESITGVFDALLLKDTLSKIQRDPSERAVSLLKDTLSEIETDPSEQAIFQQTLQRAQSEAAALIQIIKRNSNPRDLVQKKFAQTQRSVSTAIEKAKKSEYRSEDYKQAAIELLYRQKLLEQLYDQLRIPRPTDLMAEANIDVIIDQALYVPVDTLGKIIKSHATLLEEQKQQDLLDLANKYPEDAPFIGEQAPDNARLSPAEELNQQRRGAESVRQLLQTANETLDLDPLYNEIVYTRTNIPLRREELQSSEDTSPENQLELQRDLAFLISESNELAHITESWELPDITLTPAEQRRIDNWCTDLQRDSRSHAGNGQELAQVFTNFLQHIPPEHEPLTDASREQLTQAGRDYLATGEHAIQTHQALSEYRREQADTLRRTQQLEFLQILLTELALPTPDQIDAAIESDRTNPDILQAFNNALQPREPVVDFHSLDDLCTVPDDVRDALTTPPALGDLLPDTITAEILRLRTARTTEQVIRDRVQRRDDLVNSFYTALHLDSADAAIISPLLTDPRLYSYYCDTTTLELPLRDRAQEANHLRDHLSTRCNLSTLNFDIDFLNSVYPYNTDSTVADFIANHQALADAVPTHTEFITDNHDDLAEETLHNAAEMVQEYHLIQRYAPAIHAERIRILGDGSAEHQQTIRTEHERSLISVSERAQLEQDAHDWSNNLWENTWRYYNTEQLHAEHLGLQHNIAGFTTLSNQAYQAILDAIAQERYHDIPALRETWREHTTELHRLRTALKDLEPRIKFFPYTNAEYPQPPDTMCPESLLKDDSRLKTEWEKLKKSLDSIIDPDPSKRPRNSEKILANAVTHIIGGEHTSKLIFRNSINTSHIIELALRRYAIDFFLNNYSQIAIELVGSGGTMHEYLSKEELLKKRTSTFITNEQAATLADYMPAHVPANVQDTIRNIREEKENNHFVVIEEKRTRLNEIVQSARPPYQELLQKQMEYMEQRYMQLREYESHRTSNPNEILGKAFFVTQDGQRLLGKSGKGGINDTYYSAASAPVRGSDITEKVFFEDIIPSYETSLNFLITYYTKLESARKKSKITENLLITLARLPEQLFYNPPAPEILDDGFVGYLDTTPPVPQPTVYWLRAKNMKDILSELGNQLNFDADRSEIRDKFRYRKNLVEELDNTPMLEAKSNYDKFQTVKTIMQHPNDIAHFRVLMRACMAEIPKATVTMWLRRGASKIFGADLANNTRPETTT